MPLGYLEDDDGNHSSKRLCAVLLIASGIILAFVLCGISIFKPIADSNSFLKVIEYFIAGGVTLGVGGTAAENISNLFKKSKGAE